ncbi:MAG: AI-2E family transporter [Candidatus Saccharimonadales bacterium]
MLGFRNKKDAKEVWLNVSNRTVIRVIVLVIIFFLFLLSLHRAAHALLLIGVAFFLAMALNAPVHWIDQHLPGKNRKHRGTRMAATTVSFVVVIVVIGAFLAIIVPPLVRQTSHFINEAPALIQEVRSQKGDVGNFVRKYHLQKQANSLSNQIGSRLTHLAGTAYSTIGQIVSSVLSLVVIIVLTFMMLVEGPYWLTQIKRVVPHDQRERTAQLARDMAKVVKGYVNGQVLLAAIAAALIVPGLFILHISYPLALMVVIFVCGLIPIVGHSIGAVIVTIVALFHAPLSALIILLYYILYIQVENYIIQPHIQASTTNLSPLLVIMSVVIGVEFGGIIGGLVALPVAGCIRVAVIDYLENEGKLEPSPILPPPINDAK